MTARILAGLISFSIMVSGLVFSGLFQTMMIGEINRKREDGNLVSYFGSTLPKTLRIFSEYRQSYPEGRLHIYSLLAFAVAIVALLVTAACIGFFG